MNKFIFIIILTFAVGTPSSAQDWSEIFSKYNTRKGVESVYISPEMFKMIGRLPEVEMADKDLDITSAIVSLKGLYVLESEVGNISETLLSDVHTFIKSNEMQLLLNEKEGDEQSEIYVSKNGNSISRILFMSKENDDNELDVIVIEGNLSQENFNKLITKSIRK